MTYSVGKARKDGFRFTGRMFLATVVAFFAVIIAVNVTMAVLAIRTFPGLEAKNGWVASQNFNSRLAAQKALGWEVTPTLTDRQFALDIRGKDGRPAAVSELTVTIGRPTVRDHDITPPLHRRADGVFEAPVRLDPGVWEIVIRAKAADGTDFYQRRRVHLPGA